MAIHPFKSLEQARDWAALHNLREKAVCFVVRGTELLVFDHVPAEDSGVQVPAGGVEAGETPEQGAVRELYEESGLVLRSPAYLCSYEWKAQLPDRYTRQVCHAYVFLAPPSTSHAWEKHADEHLFSFRWASVASPGLDWEMDAALPELIRYLQETV